MLIYLKKSFLFLALLFAFISFQSCDEEGCMDPNAENYNADADTDDGSCTYARTKFIGTYGAGESCDGADATSNIVIITESSIAFNAITITNQAVGVTVTGLVTGNGFTIDDTFIQNGTEVEMKGSGTYSDDGDEKIDVEFTLTIEIANEDVSQSCVGLWLKS